MAWTEVQKSAAVNHTTTGTTTPTLPAGSTAGNLLVACLVSRTGGTAFTGPAGWIQGPNAQEAAIFRSEVWYYPANPGGISSAAFTSGTASVSGELAEFAPSAGTVATDSTGTAAATSGATLLVTAGSANAAGDLAVASYGSHYSASTTITWTDPSGFTLIDSSGSSSGTDFLYGAYNLNAAAGTLAVTGTVSTSTNLTAFTGVIVTFYLRVPFQFNTEQAVKVAATR